jgi:hypothetical protein
LGCKTFQLPLARPMCCVDLRHDRGWYTEQHAHHLHCMSSTEALDFPLRVAKSASSTQKIHLQTHAPSPIPEILFGTTAHLLRVIVDIKIRPGIQVLYLVDA